MSENRFLPARPDLRRLRDEAKARRRAGEFASLSLAHLAIAREHGFASWPRLKLHIDALTLDAGERAAALVRSACSSNVRRARVLLDADPDLARHDLACACVTGEVEEVRRRLHSRPAETARLSISPLDHAPLSYACFSRLLRADPERAPGIRAVARLLLDAGADPDVGFDHEGWAQVPLYGAAGIANDAELTGMLIAAGADPNDGNSVHTVGEALYHACEFPDPTCAELLLEAGTEPSVVDYCLGRALNFPHPEMVEMFCAHGARASADNLAQAVWRRRPPRTVSALLDAGAPVDGDGELTPLRVAVRWGEEEVAALLVARGADATRVTPQDRALGAFLSRAQADAPSCDEALDELLHLVVQTGDLATVRRLLDAGARVDGDPADEDGPIRQAAWRGHADVVGELAARGAALTFPNGGSAIGAALHGSRHCHHPEGGPTMQTIDEVPRDRYAAVVRMLLDAGAPVPKTLWEGAASPTTLIAELGVQPPGQG